ncbi:MAG TPA: GntR family transcriptional regulator [Vicinamibacterales bacterium]
MLFQINFKSAKPVYLQLVDQVKAAAAAGLLRAGDALPSIRPLSEELRVNRNTVAKAYGQLESEGIIETQPGRGCFVRSAQSPLRKDARRRLLIAEIDDVIVQAHHLQVPAAELLDLVRERFDALAARQSSHADKQGTHR